jgi:hypothetical protein
MDVTTQTKLTRDEWNSIELPVQTEELSILHFIQQGFHDPMRKENAMKSMYTYLKLDPNPGLDLYLCEKFMIPMKTKTVIPLKKADQIRIQSVKQIPDTVYEKVLLSLCDRKEYFHLEWMIQLNVNKPNPYVMEYVKGMISAHPYVPKWTDAVSLLERNPYTSYKDRELYVHQKELFTVAKNEGPKLILYVAPTGTGKTMSPVGLSEKYHIIFVCAAKHVSMALAKMCLSLQKKVAFALGCSSEEDIKLHYSAAVDYIKNRKTGGIAKVDNTNGIKVEIMISDIQSYLYAMNYMLRFQPKEKLLLYWDEPTIAMDVEEHVLHPIIQQMWKENVIPNVVLSSATLPSLDYSLLTNSTIYSIHNGESNKTIQLINSSNQIILPHHVSYENLPFMVEHLKRHTHLLKYVDLGSVITFLMNKKVATVSFTISDIKKYYLSFLENMTKEEWQTEQLNRIQVPSTIRMCSEDAWTCSYGPSIYIAEDVQKIATYCLKTAAIPPSLLEELTTHLSYNKSISEKMKYLENDLEDKNKDSEKEKKMSDNRLSPEVKKIQEELKVLQASIRTITLPNVYIPNKYEHLSRYGKVDKLSSAFTSDIDLEIIEKVLSTDIDASWKILLMMGIGVFSASAPPRYMELVKEQVMKQKVYLILATSDYIYGTNYQFANLYLGKDMNVTQEKLIQTLGRVGRGKQVPYTIRFRDDKFANILFTPQDSPESNIMKRLFS